MTTVWYHVRDLGAACEFYAGKLGFTEIYHDERGSWAKLAHGEMDIGLAQGEPREDGAVAHVDVQDVKLVADRLRGEGVDVGVVIELHGQMRLLDVFDPDGNRLQLAQDIGS
jgi:catechol 2,3-dioxygenase-like lactoylglutathione lyase family enzyme